MGLSASAELLVLKLLCYYFLLPNIDKPVVVMPFCLSLSILVAIFSGGPGLASIRMSQFWILLELRMEL